MPVRVVVVHDEPEFVRPLTEALTGAGYEVTAFANPMSALQALEAAESVVGIDVLITRFRFGTPQPLGPSLARVTQAMHPEMSVIFVAESRFQASVKDMGDFIPSPAGIEDVAAMVARRTSRLAAQRSQIRSAWSAFMTFIGIIPDPGESTEMRQATLANIASMSRHYDTVLSFL